MEEERRPYRRDDDGSITDIDETEVKLLLMDREQVGLVPRRSILSDAATRCQ